MNKHPDALSDLDWYKHTFTTMLGNSFRMMEAMGATDQQKNEIGKMIDQTRDITSNPERARKNINKLMQSFSQLSDSVYGSAEMPGMEGIYRKSYNIPKWSGNYLDFGNGYEDGGTVQMRTPDGKMWNIPSGKVDLALKRGAMRVR